MARALGRYELLRPLARGGMAEVYLARRRAAGVEKWLVVKRMRPETSGDPRFLDLFVREARLSMSLVHQNIVPVFDFGRIDEQVFLAMERVEGKDLGSSLARARPHRLPALLAAFVAAECCQALDYAHQRKSPDGVALGVVHRDVTPRNVLLSWSGEVKLTDFGIAALAGEATSRLLGTPQYMAPEQARSEPIDPRADIYAVGLVLREAVTGVRARPGNDRDTILDAARRGELLPWSHLATATAPPGELATGSGDLAAAEPTGDEPPPAELVAIIDRATAALPADRYPDARSMLEALDGFIVGERAARKAESPARQLAAWLSAVWDGARDDIETDATIDGDHLVSFLDDGAIDVLGTGTVRSLAATAAEDAAAPSTVPGPAPAPADTGSPTIAAAPPVALAIAPGSPADLATRPGRVSSSTAAVASGSFDTLAAGANPTRVSELRRRKRRQISPLVGVVLVAVAAGAVVFFIMNGLRERDRPSLGPPILAQQATRPTSPAPPSPAPPSPAPPSPEPPAATPVHAAAANPEPPTATPVHAAPAGRPGAGLQSAGQPRGEPPHPRPPHPTATATATAPLAGPRPAPAAGHDGSGSDQARAAVCRVRINLTPWAYYKADDDPTQHETPSTVELTPGRHRLHVWNPELHVERDIAITVPADRDTMNYSEPLQPAPTPVDAGPAS